MADAAHLPPMPSLAWLHFELSDFLYREAELLDDRRYSDWFGLLSPDIRYRMPSRVNLFRRDEALEISNPLARIMSYDDDASTLLARVRQLEMDTHWSEEPASRTRRLITNVRVTAVELVDGREQYSVRSSFLCYRNRLETSEDTWIGRRDDIIGRTEGGELRLVSRSIVLDQSTILSNNVTQFF